MTTPLPPPGWYPDPSGAPGLRYFDGRDWTEHRASGAGMPQPPRPRKRTVWPWALLGVFVLFFGGCVALIALGASGGGDKPTTATTSVRATLAEPIVPPTRTVAPAGSAVRDGKFEFQVLNIASTRTIGADNPYMQTTAQGVFVVFTLKVTNIGNEPQNFFAQNQKLIDSTGREYGASTKADMSLNTDVPALGQINPGNSIEVKVAFDVQPDIVMQALELHDSMFSGGVLVAPGVAR